MSPNTKHLPHSHNGWGGGERRRVLLPPSRLGQEGYLGEIQLSSFNRTSHQFNYSPRCKPGGNIFKQELINCSLTSSHPNLLATPYRAIKGHQDVTSRYL